MREMRRSDRAIKENESKTLLQGGEYGILSYVNIDGIPVGIPLNYFYDGNHLYFHCANEGEKIDGIHKNQDISFTVVGKTKIIPEKKNTTNLQLLLVLTVDENVKSHLFQNMTGRYTVVTALNATSH